MTYFGVKMLISAQNCLFDTKLTIRHEIDKLTQNCQFRHSKAYFDIKLPISIQISHFGDKIPLSRLKFGFRNKKSISSFRKKVNLDKKVYMVK